MNKKLGFTLVELSIVLVIIGLLIGGILVGRSMVETARVSSQIAQFQRLDAAIVAFRGRQNALPGDAKNFGGDNDGMVDMTAATGYDNNADLFRCEIANFWYSLDPDNYVSTSCPGGSLAISEGTNKNVPEAKLGSKGSVLLVSIATSDGCTANMATPVNYYAILPANPVDSAGGVYRIKQTGSAFSAVKPVEALAMDTKIDDGKANAGNIISGAIGSCVGQVYGGIITSPAAGTCSSGATYSVSDNNYKCTPLVAIGTMTGS